LTESSALAGERFVKTVLVILVVILVLLQLRLWFGPGSLSEISLLGDGIVVQTEENLSLQQRNQGLMEEVGDLRNGLDAIEERARSELGLIRRGETFFLMVEDVPEEVQDIEDVLAPAVEPAAELAPALEPGAEPEIFTSSETAMVLPIPPPDLEADPAPEPPPVEEESLNPYLELFRDEEQSLAPLPPAATGR